MLTLFLLLSLLLLYFTKSFLIGQFSRLIHRLGGGQRGAIITWSIIFLPGTIIHEISHFLIAAFTGARTGKIEIFPEYLSNENGESDTIALGYVQTQTLNPVQGFLVGTAPFVSGIILLVFLSSQIFNQFQNKNFGLLTLFIYLFFTIANSFFPSWSDIKQALPLVVIAGITLIGAWLLGFQILFTPSDSLITLATTLYQTLFLSAILNLFIILILLFLNRSILGLKHRVGRSR